MKIPHHSRHRLPGRYAPWLARLVIMFVIGIGATARAEVGAATADRFPNHPDLSDYIKWASNHHPQLTQQSARTAALRASAEHVGALPALKLTWGEMLVPVETRVGPQQRVFGVSQSIPWFGTLSAREKGVAADAAAAQEEERGSLWQIEGQVRAAWWELGLAYRQIEIVGAALALAEQTESYTRAQYEAGDRPFAALLNAQMEVGRLATRLVGLEDYLAPLTVRLNAAAGLRSSQPGPDAASFEARELRVNLPHEDQMVAFLHRRQPNLVALHHTVVGRQHQVAAARGLKYPDFTLGVDYIMTAEGAMPGLEGSGRDPVIARVGVNVPLWGGSAKAAEQASAGMLRAANAGLEATRLKLVADFHQMMFAWRDANRSYDLHQQTLLPRSSQKMAVVTASYQAGQVDFDHLQKVLRGHLDLELALAQAETDRLLALNDLATLLGVEMNDLSRGELPASDPDSESEQP